MNLSFIFQMRKILSSKGTGSFDFRLSSWAIVTSSFYDLTSGCFCTLLFICIYAFTSGSFNALILNSDSFYILTLVCIITLMVVVLK